MKRRQFLKGALYGASGTMIALSGCGVVDKIVPTATAQEAQTDKVVYSACEMCRNACPTAIRVKNDKVVKVDGNPNDPVVDGTICARGQAAPSLLYDPQRIKKPMIRTGGERGDGKFKEVSWDEAYDYIAKKINDIKQQYGPEAIAFASRKGPHDMFFRNIGKAIGSPNLFSHESTCPLTRSVGYETTIGFEFPAIDYGNVKYLLAVGRNWFEGIHVAQAKGIRKALNNGAKIVVLDPRFNVTASKGEWVPIRPTTDLAFVMAMAHVMIKENLYDKEFVAHYTEGFDKWAEEVKDKTPEWAEVETDVSKDTIIRIAREFAQAAPQAVFDPGWRTALTPNDYQLRRAIMFINLMIGNIEVPGGFYVKKSADVVSNYPEYFDSAIKNKGLGGPGFKQAPQTYENRIDNVRVKGTPGDLIPAYDGAVGQIPISIMTEKPYPIKGWMVHRFNPIIAMTGSDYVIEAIKKLDLIVTCDLYMTDTAWYSDVVLPECTYMERTEQIYNDPTTKERHVWRQKAIEPMYDTKPAWLIYKELGEKMGYGEFFAYNDIEDIAKSQLSKSDITLEELREKGIFYAKDQKVFFLRENNPKADVGPFLKTPFKFYSHHVEESTGEGLPKYVQYDKPKEGQFFFTQGKVAVHTNDGTHNIPVLYELMPENTLWINTESATKLGINDGDEIFITAGTKEVKGRAKVTEGIRPDTVFTYHGFGRISPEMKRAYGKGFNDNKLMSEEIGVVGNSITSTILVTVRKG